MKVFLCTAAILLLGSVAGCGSKGLFKAQEFPESPEAAAAPWPRLVDTPAAPPKGQFGPGVPDPAEGTAAAVELTLAARDAAERAAALAPPPLTEAEKRRLGK
ncbi:MAG TPA: hypothetical protein VLA52_16165 [Thermohalobaculum sp.]|nr:hypothetical protein [Thermohalobaculum sp.]